MQQVLLGSASLWEIFLNVKICLEKQIMRCSLPRKRFTAVPFGEVNYFCIYAVDLAKGVLKNFIAVQTLISESQICQEGVKGFIEESLSALRSLKTYNATHDSVARISNSVNQIQS